MEIAFRWSLRLAVAFAVATGIASGGAQMASAADPKYRITDVGMGLSASAMNQYGQITGSTFSSRAFLWKNDGTPRIDLGPFDSRAFPSMRASGRH